MTVQKMMTETQTNELKTLASTDQVVEAILLMLTLRERNMGTTNLYRFKHQMETEGFKFADDVYENAWVKLVSLGLGAIIRPRKNRFNAEFVWNYNLVDVANHTFDQGKIQQFKKEHKPAPTIVQSAPKKRQGRPKGSKNKRKAKGKVGRPKGSKNKDIKVPLTKQEVKVLQGLLSRLA